MKNKKNMKLLAAALAVTGTCSLLAFGISQSVLAMELGKTENVKTQYPSVCQTETNTENKETKRNYTVLDDSLYDNSQRLESQLTRDEAAEIGVKLVEELYDINLDGTYIYMGYMSGTETFPRAFWSGDIRLTGQERKPGDDGYSFMIDAVTGEYFSASSSRVLSDTVDLGLDASLEKDNSEFQAIVKSFVEQKQLLDTPVSKVLYNCQGYESNDPSITFDVYGEDGKRLLVTYSRYDKTFRGIGFNASLVISEKAFEDLEEKLNENAVIMPTS